MDNTTNFIRKAHTSVWFITLQIILALYNGWKIIVQDTIIRIWCMFSNESLRIDILIAIVSIGGIFIIRAFLKLKWQFNQYAVVQNYIRHYHAFILYRSELLSLSLLDAGRSEEEKTNQYEKFLALEIKTVFSDIQKMNEKFSPQYIKKAMAYGYGLSLEKIEEYLTMKVDGDDEKKPPIKFH